MKRRKKKSDTSMRPIDRENMIQALKDEAGTTIALNHQKSHKKS